MADERSLKRAAIEYREALRELLALDDNAVTDANLKIMRRYEETKRTLLNIAKEYDEDLMQK